MQSLTELEIWTDRFKALPDCIGNLRNLSGLVINSSSIEKLPDSICNLFSLKELLFFKGNKLSSLPDSIGNLTNLTRLNINYSAIEKLPDSIGNLNNLEEFYLCYSAVKSIPDCIGNLQNLTDLQLAGSKIEKLPDSIGNLEKLTRLSLANNKNLKRIPDSIGNLKKLVTLNLSGTAIEILPDTLANCSSLEYVDVCNTSLTSLPNFISSIKYLRQSIKLMPEKGNISYISFCNYYYTLVEKIFRFSTWSRRNGLPAIDDELENIILDDTISEGFFKTGMRLVVDGSDGAIIRELLTLKIERENDHYIKKLKEIAMEGILCIQSGDGVPQIGIRLASMVDIKNNLLETACAKYLSGDFEAFDNIDFKSALQPEGEREEIRFIKRALRINEISRKEGWLELDKHLDKDGIAARDIFEYGLPMVIDNWDYADIDKNLTLLIARETDPVRKNLALAKKHAVKMIYEGDSPWLIKSTLLAYFDDDVALGERQ